MKRICLVLLTMFLFTGCTKQNEQKELSEYTFQLSNNSYLITVTESDVLVSDKSGTLTYPVCYRFAEQTLSYESVSYSYTPLPTSVLQVGQLICQALSEERYEDIFCDEPYKITVSNNGMPSSLVWGDFYFEFIQ